MKYLVILAVIIAFGLGVWLRTTFGGSSRLLGYITYIRDPYIPIVINKDNATPQQFATAKYPYRWQAAQRRELMALLTPLTTPPKAHNAMGISRYAEYAIALPVDASHYEAAMREGMRRDRGNALYHYLLAGYFLQHAITGDGIHGFDENDLGIHTAEDARAHGYTVIGDGFYDYHVQDRALFDKAMAEAREGMALEYSSRQLPLAQKRYAAFPDTDPVYDWLLRISYFSSIKNPLLGICRDLARANGFYCHLLLQEGKIDEAREFARLEEYMGWQLAHDKPDTLEVIAN